jgi:hypothetical protein
MTDVKKDDQEVAIDSAYSFIEGMATETLRDMFIDVIQDALCAYRDHILNAITLDDDGSIVEEVAFSRNLLEGDSDSYLYATTILDNLTEACIELEVLQDTCDKKNA